MIVAAHGCAAYYPACGPSSIPRESDYGIGTGVVVKAPSPGPAYGIGTGIIVEKQLSEYGIGTGIITRKLRTSLRIVNNDNRPDALGSDLVHKKITYP